MPVPRRKTAARRRPGKARKGGDPAGWPRRPRQSIPLLPSGPGGVFDLASRGADGATIDVGRAARGPGTWRREGPPGQYPMGSNHSQRVKILARGSET